MIADKQKNTTISVGALQDFCQQVLECVGATSGDARTTSEVLVTTDTWGVFTHGTKLLPGYVRRIQEGGLRVDRSPQIAVEGPAWAIVDGQSTLGQVTSTFAMKQAISKARDTGVAYVGVRNSCHFGAAGYYAWLAASENMIGISMANDVPSVAAPGSCGPILGSNPIAYGVPAGDGEPLMLDISIATVAGGKVFACRERGETIPTGWLVGRDGQTTCDSSLFPQKASLAPMSGHKGYGIGLLIETLSGLLTGAAVTWQVGNWIFGDPSLPTKHGAAFVVIDIAAMMPTEEFEKRIAGLIDEIHASAVADGCQGILMPGEREWESRRLALKEGIKLPADVLQRLEQLTLSVGIDLPI